ncbi:transglutaminaseTgpA domain-containing protein [Enterococcus alishanensis]|uniref:Transglutaminase-like domain-containing protein n=1 Tax=Enterococcus alishanensis TaxID=1303817 RepID=A0ABS6TCN4_9ENTE|nr:transglutaminaseTgpA domain-containing protein [Enterococcus alishanensis]MBV7390691.1 transglutaminase-like domain-containing protein [Enterococcus alishanensis]
MRLFKAKESENGIAFQQQYTISGKPKKNLSFLVIFWLNFFAGSLFGFEILKSLLLKQVTNYQNWLVITIGVIFSLLLLLRFFSQKKGYDLAVIAFFATYGILFLPIYRQFSGLITGTSLNSPTTLSVSLLFVFVVSLIYLMVVVLRQRFIFTILAAVVLFVSPYIGIETTGFWYGLLFFIIVTNYVLTGSNLAGNKNNIKAFQRKTNIIGKTTIIISLLFSSVFLAFYLLLQPQMSRLLEIPIQLETRVRDLSLQLLNINQESINGRINRGNNYPSDQEEFRVTVSQLPTEDLYLKDQAWSDYQGDQWSELNEQPFFDELTTAYERNGWGTNYYANGNYFDGRYTYLLDYGNDWDYSANQAARNSSYDLQLEKLNQNLQSYYQPYYSLNNYGTADNARYRLLSQTDYLTALNQADPNQIDWFDRVENLYSRYVQSEYTKISTEEVPRIAELVASQNLTERSEITAFIIDQLHSRASYSLTPGVMPFGEDIAEGFLFDTRQGYCQHFATAAVIMYRLFDQPARYTTGYKVPVSSFEEQENGQYVATVKDGDAHAWVELYQENSGWLPVEVTPDATNQASLTNQENTTNVTNTSTRQTTFLSRFGVVLVTIFLAISLVIVSFWLRHRYNKKNAEKNQQRADQAFQNMLSAVRYAKKIPLTGNEADFSKQMHELFPMISEGKFTEILRLVIQTSFSPTELSASEVGLVNETVQQAMKKNHQEMTTVKKIIAKYWYVY